MSTAQHTNSDDIEVIHDSKSATTHPSVAELRHRAEVPALIGAGVLTVIGLIAAAIFAANG